MKTRIIKILLATFVLFGCEDFLDQEPLNNLSVATVFKTEDDIRYALNGLYRQIRGLNAAGGNSRQSEYLYVQFTDDAVNRVETHSSDLDFSPSLVNVEEEWAPRYATIRDVNEFLKRAVQAKDNFSDPVLFDRYMAEARFIRAINYARLNFLFGAVPLLTQPTEPDYFPKRALRIKVFDFVANEFTEIADLLPEEYSDSSDAVRITRGAALAVKARHMLNAIDWHPDKAGLYAEAADAAGDVYSSGIYSLDNGAEGYQNLFTRVSANGASSGAILTINYDRVFKDNKYQNTILPKGAFSGIKRNNSNYTGATSSLVEAFQMQTNGLSIHDAMSGYDPADPWTDRDPRLDITVLRGGEVIPVKGGDGVNDLYVFEPHPRKNPSITLPNGTTVNAVTTDDVNKNGINRTGYNYQKYMDFDFIDSAAGDIQYHFIRFAEVVLIYAEAVLGRDGDINLAMSLLDGVRTRVDMPNVATSYGPVGSMDQALDIILKERRFEFALEGPQHYFDIRRHRLGEKVFADTNVYGIPLGPNRKPNRNVDDGDLDDSKKVLVFTRNFTPDQYYEWPLPQNAIDNNQNLLEDPE